MELLRRWSWSRTLPAREASLFALFATALTLWVRLALDEVLGGRPTLVIFTLPIVVSAYVGGLRAGLLATGLSCVSAYYLLLLRSESPVGLLQSSFLAVAGVVISLVSEAMHRARRGVESASERTRRAEAAVRSSELRYRTLFEYAPDGILIADSAGRYLDANPSMCRMLGYAQQELVGKESADIVSPLEYAHIAPALEAINASGDYHREWRFRRKDGSGFDADVHATRMPDGLLIATVRDVSERKQAAQRIARLNRLYSVLSGINSLIVRATQRAALFEEACRIAVEKGGFVAAWIGEIHDGVAAARLAAWAGVGGAYREAVEATWRDRLPPRPGMEAVVTLGEPVIVNDLSTDARVRLRDQALESGIRSLAVLPLMLAGKPVALFTLCAAQTEVFDADEVHLLLELTRDLSFALDHIEKVERLEYLGYYDALTGLANRSLLLERIAQFMRSAAGKQHKLGLLLIDLERFKNINDSLGQAKGDQLLRQVAEWLAQQAGDAGLVARVGPDHFAMILPTATQELDVARLIETLLARLLKHPFRIDGTELRIAAKLGAALYPEDGEDAATLYKHAEAALKQAKVGGERALFYARKMTASVAERLALETQLRQALENREFVLHYQPKADLRTRRVTGAEALIRWKDPRTGLVPPFKFIPVLEATGLIHDVGRWAIEQALQDYLRWRAAGLRAVPIAVNVSSLQLRSPSFVDEIAQAVGVEAGAAAGLQLEITESMIMGDIEASIVTLQKIRSMGISIALDDFGTGFSSLSYLARLPVTTIKIDRSFVVDMEKSASGESLIASMIQLSQSLRLKVVAEGVETETQASLLLSHGCDELQGYLFGRPMPTEQFEEQFLRPAA